MSVHSVTARKGANSSRSTGISGRTQLRATCHVDQLSHLGRFSIYGSDCLNPETGQSANGEFTLTAANGDQLELGYPVGQAIPQPPFPPTVFHWTIQGLWCDGGTGRFASATCEGAWGGGFNMVTRETWSTIDAAITYTASDRRD